MHPRAGKILEGCTNMDTYCSIADTWIGMRVVRPQKIILAYFLHLFLEIYRWLVGE